MVKYGLVPAITLAFSAPLMAQPSGSASAKDPEALVALLEEAGYAPELSTDSFGDPEIELEIAGYGTTILFYGCDEETNTDCDSVQLRAGFDRGTPWTAAEAVELTKKYRFIAVWLDDEGDPYLQWDILTGDGISAPVFLTALERFGSTLEDAAAMIFADR